MSTQDTASACASTFTLPSNISPVSSTSAPQPVTTFSASEPTSVSTFIVPGSTHMSTIGIRVKKVSDLTGIGEKELFEFLKNIGIDDTPEGLQLLDSDISSVDELDAQFSRFVTVPILKRKAAVAILKGNNPFKKDPPEKKINVTSPDTLTAITKVLRNINNMSDFELIALYDTERDLNVEQELDRRARHQPFIILTGVQYEPGKEQIDIELSCEQLKRARKGYIVPTMIPGREKRIVRVYRITELNPDDRIVELCPICEEILYKGYCSKCELDFSGIKDDERAYVRLIVNCEKFNAKSHSDRKAVHASASKGLNDLRVTWPSIAPTFDDLKMTNSLPKVRMIKNIPATQVADPFHVSGNR